MAARLVRVSDVEDPAVEPYARVRERDLVRGSATGEGAFVAEGEVVVRVLVERRRLAVRSLLLEERRVEPLRDVIDALPEAAVVYVAPQAVMDGIVGFPIHRGVLALGLRGAPLEPASLLVRPGVVVGLVGRTNHDNVGGIFRNAAAFGVRGVLLDETTCDPLYRKAIRVSVGAALVVPFARCASWAAMLDALESAGWEPIALSPSGRVTIDEIGRAHV